MKIGVLVPTVTGREEHLARCITSHCPWQGYPYGPVPAVWPEWYVSVQKDYPTCGEAWAKGLPELLARGVDYVCITCDDFEARGVWWPGAVAVCDAGELPAPQLWNAGEDERWESSRLDGEVGEIARCTRSPHLLSAVQAEAIFGVRIQLEPFQYYGDYLLGDIGHRLGMVARIAPGFCFTHHWAQVGRHTDEQNAEDQKRYNAALHRLDHLLPLPSPYIPPGFSI